MTFNGTITYPPGQLGFHPGPAGQYSVVRFTAPFAGLYTLTSVFSELDVSASTDVHVLLNGASLFNGFVNGAPSSFNSGLTLDSGDHLDFAVGFGVNGNFLNDSTGLVAILSANTVPEPSSLTLQGIAMLCLVGLGFLQRRASTKSRATLGLKAPECPRV